MWTRNLPVACAAVVGVLIGASSARADKPTKAKIAKIGKAATAFIEVAGRRSGTAFCVHSSGLFVTNEHVVRGKEKEQIKVVVNASLKTQRVFQANVVRMDKALDLALVRVDSKDPLPSLALGSVDGITELMEVVAFGFPLGAALSPDGKEYPAISVNAGTVSSLRRKKGDIERIQLDVSVTFGSSGGPVLDEKANVIGVIVAGVRGERGINMAIPVSHVKGFLSAPDIAFTPPEIARVICPADHFQGPSCLIDPRRKEPNVRLILHAGDEKPRAFPMTKHDGVFVATAVPTAATGDKRVEISVRLKQGMIAGLVDDFVLTVGGKPVRLSSVRRIEFKTKPLVVLADGKTNLEGEIGGLAAVDIALGNQKVRIDLHPAVQIQVTPPAEIYAVSATVVASVDGKEVGRAEASITVRDATQIGPADPSTVAISPPALADDRVVKRLPAAFDDLCLGGGGRFFIFHLPKLHKLGVFDVNEAKVTHYIDVAENTIAFAAGLDKLVIGLPEKGVLERWSLTTFERELVVAPSFMDKIAMILMGHASNGPVVVNGIFMDLGTLRPLPINKGERVWEAGVRLYPSGDGTVFGTWNNNYSPGTASTFVLEGDKVTRYTEGTLGHVIPGPDGNTAFTAQGVLSSHLQRADRDDAKYGWCLPAVRGSLFLSLQSGAGGKGGSATVYVLGQHRPIAKLEQLQHGMTLDGWARGATGPWRNIFFIPQANVIAFLPGSKDQVVLYKFNVDAALEKSGIDYLMVVSQSQSVVKRGSTFHYSIQVKAKRTPVSFKLESGPASMSVSKEGTVTWKVPDSLPEGDQEAILTVRDAGGQEIFHTFKLRVVR